MQGPLSEKRKNLLLLQVCVERLEGGMFCKNGDRARGGCGGEGACDLIPHFTSRGTPLSFKRTPFFFFSLTHREYCTMY